MKNILYLFFQEFRERVYFLFPIFPNGFAIMRFIKTQFSMKKYKSIGNSSIYFISFRPYTTIVIETFYHYKRL